LWPGWLGREAVVARLTPTERGRLWVPL
jgi:hypothetical protein